MDTQRLLGAALGTPPDAAVNRRLADALEPGRRRLTAAGLCSAAASAGAAASFFALAAVAEDVLTARASWTHDAKWLALLAGAALIRASAAYASARVASNGALAVEGDLRARLLARLMEAHATSLSSAAHATAVLDEVERVGGYAERYQPARVAAVMAPLVLLAAVFPVSWPVGVLLLLCAPLPPVNLSIVGMGTASVARRHAEELRYLSGYFLDRLRGLATLRALGAEQTELARVRDASERLAERAMAVLRVAFVSAGVLEAIVTVAVALIAIYVGLTLLGYVDVPGLPSHMSLRSGLFVLMVTPLYFQPVRALAAAYHERADALAAIEALQPLLASAEPKASPRRALRRAPAIVVSELTVSFREQEAPALFELSLSVEPGELIGVAGASGAGKSTLLRVLAGDVDPTSGAALLDGAVPGGVERTAICWLGQRPYLFPGTIQDNITLGRTGHSKADLLRAAHDAGLADLLDRLPHGLGTPVGDGGWGFSGGEIQRLALARTLLAGTRLMLLDEPTAHLDALTESRILRVICRAVRGATTVIASHSPAVLAVCDRVLTLDRGQLVVEEAHLEPEAVAAG
jgi:ATP-binding cassette, subfamily C, bacterial CydD